MRFLVDAQLPPALARWIASHGHWAEHVADCGLVSAPDGAIRAYAANTDAVIVTKDEDFVIHRLLSGGPAVVWVRAGNTRRVELLRRFDAGFAEIIDALERGDRVVEIA